MDKHRHHWKPLTEIVGLIGQSYVWYRCECGVRKVVTLSGGKVAARRLVRPK